MESSVNISSNENNVVKKILLVVLLLIPVVGFIISIVLSIKDNSNKLCARICLLIHIIALVVYIGALNMYSFDSNTSSVGNEKTSVEFNIGE